jgi:hypothetical protein
VSSAGRALPLLGGARAGRFLPPLGLPRAGRILVTALCFVVLIVLGVLAPRHPSYALAGAFLVLLIGVYAADPGYITVLAIPATLLVFRLGGGGTNNLSVADFVLFLATLCALPLMRLKEAPEIRPILAWALLYQAVALITVVAHPYRADIIEWFHRLMIVSGALVVGWVVGNRGRGRAALTAYVIGCCVLAVWAIPVGIAHGFHPPGLTFDLQKNFVGDMLSFSVIICHLNPPWVALPKRFALAAEVLCGLGTFMIGSRQAMIAVVVVLLVCTIRDRQLARRTWPLLVGLIPLATVAYLTVSRQVESSDAFNSVHQRISWYRLTWELWHTSPLFGVGMRYYYTNLVAPQFQFQPPNGEFETLVETGIVGLAVLAVFIGFTLVRMWRLPTVWGLLPFAVVLARVVQAQADIFWVGALGALPWLVVGVAMGTRALQRRTSADPEATTDPSARSPGLRTTSSAVTWGAGAGRGSRPPRLRPAGSG